MHCLLKFLPQVTCVPLCEHSLPWVCVPPCYVCMLDGRVRSWRLNSATQWRGSLFWATACCSNDLIHLQQLRAEGQTRPEQHDETTLSEQAATEALSFIFSCKLWQTEQRDAVFFTATALTRKITESPEMTEVYVFLTKLPLAINARLSEEQRQKLCGFALKLQNLFRRRSGWLLWSSECSTSTQDYIHIMFPTLSQQWFLLIKRKVFSLTPTK